MNDQTLQPIDLTKKLRPYENKWVALSLDQKKVLGAGDSLQEAELEAMASGEKYRFLKVPAFDVSYVPTQI